MEELCLMYILILASVPIVVFVYLFLRQKKFGRIPDGERMIRIKKSPHFYKGSFQNLNHTPSLTEGVSMFSVLKEFFFERKKRVVPVDPLPAIKTDLKKLKEGEDVLVWFGHSSYFIQVDGKRILVDPVFSDSASPLPFGTRAFKGTNIYSWDDMPEIDILFISHDHWDHLDYTTVLNLKHKVKLIICSLGTAEHLEYWGFDPKMIIEKGWYEKIDLEQNFSVQVMPARHFSGRGFKRNMALWASFVLKTPNYNLFLGGDSGYDTHFKTIGLDYGPFDLVILENGQYNVNWKYIHTLPEEFLQIISDLRARRVLSVHHSKFALANHPWDEPLNSLIANNLNAGANIATPMIGEVLDLKNEHQKFTHWWKGIN